MTREQHIRLAIAWMRRSHTRYANAGIRTEDVIAGERAYQRWRKRCQTAAKKAVA